MDGLTLAIVGVATASNFAFIKFKFDKKRYSDAILDLTIFVSISFMFAGSMAGMSIGMISSALLSIYLWFSPPKELFGKNRTKNTIKTRNIQNGGVSPGEDALNAFLQGLEDIKRGV